ncbi:hypothetical protein AX16_009779 [Volvariella volvacea WC 439]|nr:hypothetical protein AX16_009779 [Volvariella volvacea WC 439]
MPHQVTQSQLEPLDLDIPVPFEDSGASSTTSRRSRSLIPHSSPSILQRVPSFVIPQRGGGQDSVKPPPQRKA